VIPQPTGGAASGKALTAASYYYEYQLKDHLGNVRVTFTDKDKNGVPEVQSENHYYPFGMPIGALSYTNNVSTLNSIDYKNEFFYNGKEAEDDFGLGWLDYGARMYDPVVGRFWTPDRFSEKYAFMSPYQYGANNPVLNIDVNGDSVQVTGKEKNIDRFIKILNDRTGNTYAVQNGYLTRTSQNLNTQTNENFSGDLSQVVESAITGNGVIPMNIVKNSGSVLIDSYQTGDLDVGDLKALKNPTFVAGQLAHIFSERMATEGNEGYGNANNRTQYLGDFEKSAVHQAGLLSEGRTVTNMLGLPFAIRTEQSTFIVNSSNTEYNVNVSASYGTATFQYTQNTSFTYTPGVTTANGGPYINGGSALGGRIIAPATRTH
jgi:RHS repeat-associated protein